MDGLYFNTLDTQEKAYWAGFIAADGYRSAAGRPVSFKGRDEARSPMPLDVGYVTKVSLVAWNIRELS